jgi:YVTN family beta-propeller protein
MRSGIWVAVAALFCLADGAAAKGTGLVFVSSEKSNAVAVLDPKTHKQIASIKTSRRPREMHFNPDRTLLYVACGDDDVIDVIDVQKRAVIDRIKTGDSPESFALSPDGSTIYVSVEESSLVQAISVKDKKVVREIPTGPEPEGVAITEDGGTIYVASEVADTVHVSKPRPAGSPPTWWSATGRGGSCSRPTARRSGSRRSSRARCM